IDARVGGRYLVAERRGEALAEHFGVYEVIDRPRRLVFTFGVDRSSPPMRVSVEIRALGGERCEISLTHEMDSGWAKVAEMARAGWSAILDGLARTIGA